MVLHKTKTKIFFLQDGAFFLGVRMVCANMERASLQKVYKHLFVEKKTNRVIFTIQSKFYK
jgi:hypothetical protein